MRFRSNARGAMNCAATNASPHKIDVYGVFTKRTYHVMAGPLPRIGSER